MGLVTTFICLVPGGLAGGAVLGTPGVAIGCSAGFIFGEFVI